MSGEVSELRNRKRGNVTKEDLTGGEAPGAGDCEYKKTPNDKPEVTELDNGNLNEVTESTNLLNQPRSSPSLLQSGDSVPNKSPPITETVKRLPCKPLPPFLRGNVNAYGTAEAYDKSQFERNNQRKVPWKSALLAIFLLLLGSTLLCISIVKMFDSLDEFQDRIAPLIILGCMSFIPGAYHCWVFVCASFELRGYSYDDIPQFK